MNDITALAQREMEQREKFEAWTEESCALPWGYLKKRRTYDGFYSEHTYTSLWAAWKSASAEMVEALETRDKQIIQLQQKCEIDPRTHEILDLRERIAELEESLSAAENNEIDARCHVAELESRTVTPVTYSESADADRCRKWAWEQVKGELSPEGWTTGDNINYFGFFCWGWDMRRQYNEQRTAGISLKGA